MAYLNLYRIIRTLIQVQISVTQIHGAMTVTLQLPPAGSCRIIGHGTCIPHNYRFVLTYGAMIMSSVVEDKVNRIVEVIVSLQAGGADSRQGSQCCRVWVTRSLYGLCFARYRRDLMVLGGWAFAGFYMDDASSFDAGAVGRPPIWRPTQRLGDMIHTILRVEVVATVCVFVIYFIGG